MSLPTLITVQKLQAALHAKAKESASFRFYTLYDKVFRADILWSAYRHCLGNSGASGVDGETFDDIEQYGVERWLNELAETLRTKNYYTKAVRRVWLPKPDGKQQYAYRPERSALDAVQAVHRLLNTGYREVVDAEICVGRLAQEYPGTTARNCCSETTKQRSRLDQKYPSHLSLQQPSRSTTMTHLAE